MPTVRFQITGLLCTKTEDRGLLDARSEDEVYLHGAVCAGDLYHPLLIGNPTPQAFKHMTIIDGQRIDLAPDEGNSWVVDLPEDARLVVGLTAHEEDANRTWPAVEDLRKEIAAVVHDAVGLASIGGRDVDPNALVAATNAVMRSKEKFEVDDLLGTLLIEGISVADLPVGGSESSVRLSGGSRLLATDFDYTLFYRVSRDDRDYAAEPVTATVSLALMPEATTIALVSFRNTGHAHFSAEDTLLVSTAELAGWTTPDVDGVDVTDEATCFFLDKASVAPGETLTFVLPLTALPVMGRAKYELKLIVPSIPYEVVHKPVTLELSSGRNLACQVETVELLGTDAAQVKLIARDAETHEIVEGVVRVTGDETAYATSQPFTVQSNLRHLIANAGASKKHDQVIWPFGNVLVEGYWPDLVNLRPH